MIRRLGLAAVTSVALSACSPLYLPPVPHDSPPEPQPVRLVGGSGLRLTEGGRPVLDLEVRDVPAETWLAVQWFAPDGREAASESALVDPATTALRFELPADVPLAAGEWRALVSLAGVILRQFSVSVPPT